MTDPRQQSVDFYESEAEQYDQRRWTSPVGMYLDETQRGIVGDMLGDVSGLKIIDVAAGTGRFSLDLARQGAHVYAVDTSAAMLNILKSKAEALGLSDRITVKQSDGAKLPFDDGNFDAATCINALNHIPDSEGVLKEIGRVLKPGGVCVVNFTVWSSVYLPFGLWINFRRRSLTREVFTHWFGKREIYQEYMTAGLDVTGRQGAMQFPSRIRNRALVNLFKLMDRVTRRFWQIAPMLFVAGRAQGPSSPESAG